MDKNFSKYIKNLIELDSKAAAFKGKKEAELLLLEAENSKYLKSINDVLEEAVSTAREEHERIIEAAKAQVREMEEAAGQKMDALQAHFESIRRDTVLSIWKQILDTVR